MPRFIYFDASMYPSLIHWWGFRLALMPVAPVESRSAGRPRAGLRTSLRDSHNQYLAISACSEHISYPCPIIPIPEITSTRNETPTVTVTRTVIKLILAYLIAFFAHVPDILRTTARNTARTTTGLLTKLGLGGSGLWVRLNSTGAVNSC